jgi:uncharacterized protein (TIGR02996 family)
MFTPEEFIQEILANPDDDTPRLIFADWLEERGDPRGEFIRVQCDIAQRTKHTLRAGAMYGQSPHGAMAESFVRHPRELVRYQALLSREIQLLLAHCKTWTGFLGQEATGVIFDRGFVTGLSTTADAFAREAPNWYRVTSIHHLCIKSPGDNLAELLSSRFLLHIHTLDLKYSRQIEDADLELLARSPNVSNLRRLELGRSLHIGDPGAGALVASPYLTKLELFDALDAVENPELRAALKDRLNWNRNR